GVAGAGPTNREVQDRKHPVAGIVERPPHVAGSAVDLYGLRRHTEVRFRTVNVVPPELETVLVPPHSPVVPPAVDQFGDRSPFPGFPVECRVDRGSGRPTPVAVPLENVDFAVRHRILIDRPERGPGTGGQAVQLYPRFPGVA